MELLKNSEARDQFKLDPLVLSGVLILLPQWKIEMACNFDILHEQLHFAKVNRHLFKNEDKPVHISFDRFGNLVRPEEDKGNSGT